MNGEIVSLKEAFDRKLKEQWVSDRRKSMPKRRRLEGGKYKTGFKNVERVHCNTCKKKFTYQYKYYDENKKRRFFTSVDFVNLMRRVKENDYEWSIIDRFEALKTAKEVGLPLRDLK